MNKTNSVLVIEDDTAIRLSLFHTLGGLGFAVGAAASGEEGLARLRMASYDVILLDINMPGIGGKETCRRISQGYPSVPIIMLTVRDDKADIVETLDAGAIDYVTKPFQIGELTSRIRAAIRRQESATGTPSGAGPTPWRIIKPSSNWPESSTKAAAGSFRYCNAAMSGSTTAMRD